MDCSCYKFYRLSLHRVLEYEFTVVLCAKKCVGVNPHSVHVRAV